MASSRLFAITDVPIKRFARDLQRRSCYEECMSLLVNHFNSATLPGLMCRDLVSVSYDGRLFDCDFNQMLELPLGGRSRSIWDVCGELEGLPISTGRHCFSCTAGPAPAALEPWSMEPATRTELEMNPFGRPNVL